MATLPDDAQVIEVRPVASLFFRDPDLTNDQAWDAMDAALIKIQDAALSARYDLLSIGFRDTHSLCKAFDETARQAAVNREVVRRDRAWQYASGYMRLWSVFT